MPLSTPRFNPEFIAPDFTLHDVVSGTEISLTDTNTSNGFVVAFICNHCPYVKAIVEQFATVAAVLKENEIPVFAIMSNNYEFVEADSPEHMQEFAAENNFSFPYLVDGDQSVAKAYDAVCTPDFFGFNKDKSMQYRGNINRLERAMLKIKETGNGPEEQAASSGCSIKWK